MWEVVKSVPHLHQKDGYVNLDREVIWVGKKVREQHYSRSCILR